MSDLLLSLAERTTYLIEDKTFHENVLGHLEKGDRYGFEREINSKFMQIMDENEHLRKILGITGEAEKDWHLASSLQYVSANFGDYIRCRYPAKKNPFMAGGEGFGLSGVEEKAIEELRRGRVAERDFNLLFCDDLIEPLQVQFGSDTPLSKFVFHVDETMWKQLQSDLRGATSQNAFGQNDFIRIILGEEVPIIVEKKEICWAALCERHKSLVSGFRKHLTDRPLVVKEEWRRLRLNDTPEDTALLFRVFLLSYFYSIMHETTRPIFHVIIPINLTKHPKKLFLNKIATYCGAFKDEVRQENLSYLQYAFRQIAVRFAELEWISVKTPGRVSLAVRENIVRLSSEVTDEAPPELRACQEELEMLVEKHIEKMSGTDEDKVSIGKGKQIEDEKIRELYKGFCSADPEMLELLRRIRDSIPKDEQGGALFLYSEPGAGKEMLAELCHYISLRSWDSGMIQGQMKKHLEDLSKLGYGGYLETVKKEYGEFLKDDSMELNIDKWKKNKRKFNFHVINCALVTEESLRGNEKVPGDFVRAHLVFGTLYLDEIDKITKDEKKRSLPDQLLRVLEKPKEIYPKDGPRPIEVNPLVIFASNVELGKLGGLGFSDAFISRVERQYFQILPLRERQEDIPLLVNHFLRLYNEGVKKHNEKIKNEQERKYRIRRVNLEGLQLLMQLKWEHNVRALKGFVDSLCEMKERKDTHQASREVITFRDILECLLERHLLLGTL